MTVRSDSRQSSTTKGCWNRIQGNIGSRCWRGDSHRRSSRHIGYCTASTARRRSPVHRISGARRSQDLSTPTHRGRKNEIVLWKRTRRLVKMNQRKFNTSSGKKQIACIRQPHQFALKCIGVIKRIPSPGIGLTCRGFSVRKDCVTRRIVPYPGTCPSHCCSWDIPSSVGS